MVERDPNDDKDVIVEIQGAAGGAEADLWAGDLFRLLTRYADRRGFKTEVLESSDGHHTFAIKGDGAYSVFKFEGGTHRVQRVPETESQGRIHTSTATVAVLPEAELLVLPESGHLVQLEEPEQVNAALRRLLDRVKLGAPKPTGRRRKGPR